MKQFDTTAWRVATNGTVNPYFVTRTIPVGKLYADYEHAQNTKGNVRRFKSAVAAQKVADKLQVTADFNDSREHLRLAVHHMLRATDGLQPNHPLMKTLQQMADTYLELTGVQL